MRLKKDWLSIAKFGSFKDRLDLATHIRVSGDSPLEIVFDNSVRGFFAEAVVEAWLTDNFEHTPDSFNCWVFERGDSFYLAPEPDGKITLGGKEWTYDIKATNFPKLHHDGEIEFKNTHNADFIFWHHDHAIHVLTRTSPKFDADSRLATAFYRQVDEDDSLLYENLVNNQLRTRFEEITK